MKVLTGNFGQRSAPQTQGVNAQTQGLEEWTADNRKAFGYLAQIYGALIAAGIYTDYELISGQGMVGMNMRSRGSDEKAPRKWISFELNHTTSQWMFRYRSIAFSGPDLDVLAVQAHERIGTLEKRSLPPLMGVMGSSKKHQRTLRSV